MNEDDKQKLTDVAEELDGAERKLIAAVENFVNAQAKAGKSKSQAIEILRQLLQKRREEKAVQHRAAFKIVD